mgnify:CR=1 FL=1
MTLIPPPYLKTIIKYQIDHSIQFTSSRGIVTADVLLQGLSRRAIATRKLEGVNWDKRHEKVYTSSASYDEGKAYV